MRILNIVCGIAVLLITLHFGHGIHHFLSDTPQQTLHSAAFLAGMLFAVAVGILSFIGGCLLLRRRL